MAAAEEPGLLRFYAESALGDRLILVDSIRTEPLSTTTIAQRVRLDVPDSMIAQQKAPTPMNGRPVENVPFKVIQANGHLVVAHKSDAADTHDPDDALAKCNLSVIARDLTLPASSPGAFRVRRLSVADRDTNRVADDQVFSTSAFVDIYAFKVPTGQEWIFHGEQEVFVADDTA